MAMTKLEAIFQPSRFDAVKEALREIGVDGMTVSEVRGHGRQKGHTEVYRGREYSVDLLPKIKIEMVLPDKLVDSAVRTVLKAAKTGKIGDGKIFLTKVDEAIRIRNEERGEVPNGSLVARPAPQSNVINRNQSRRPRRPPLNLEMHANPPKQPRVPRSRKYKMQSKKSLLCLQRPRLTAEG